MSDSDQIHVGDTFVRLAPVFKMYQTYINKYASLPLSCAAWAQ